ncbi:hypothetical protein Amsp01_064100 [Amycolatopsis sp. NBRC 101858]|uniref:DUF1707 SHOCT-like domain-containing protein n=1 Tax=Amycolatopsis sp. NBRC 101858 TaxID=3032200 RepID=UPI0024A21937|nr:DUF1707 domain-containing protein [Amycolatopsis sp. NBRC 101858]GLY40387.1 hypothetical protein Amsp01_064100 [Amycolatopsis sp. NBRC 101858]
MRSDESDPSGIRCSDAEREEARQHLAEAAGEGRLTVDEVEERLTRVAAARYRDELAGTAADLPPRTASASSSAGWAPVFGSAKRQLGADVATLLGRGEAAVGGNRRLVILIAAVAALLVFAALVVAALHGFGDDGFDHHGVDRG